MKTRLIVNLFLLVALGAPCLASAAAVDVWSPPTKNSAAISVMKIETAEPIGALVVRDFGNDGVAELVTVSGVDVAPKVTVRRGDGSVISEFAPFDPGMRQGMSLAVGDVDGDGAQEIVLGTGTGAAPHVLIYGLNGRMKNVPGGFFVGDRAARFGATVAVTDVNADGRAEIITASGTTADGIVRIWQLSLYEKAVTEISEFLPFGDGYIGGLSLASGDFDGDGRMEIATARINSSEPEVRLFRYDGSWQNVAAWTAIGNGFRGGLTLASGDIDDDGRMELIVTPYRLGGPQIFVYDSNGVLESTFFAAASAERGGLILAVGRTNIADKTTVYSVLAKHEMNRPDLAQFVRVSVPEQKLYAYEFGRLSRSFLVSTGLRVTPTPIGEFSVTDRPLIVHYKGADYDLGLVKWNLRFYPSIYIHYAPWHFNFGRRMSHGCVNVDKANAEWIYGWAKVGAAVTVEG